MGDRDIWVLYSANMLTEYRDRQEAANTQRKLGEIEYKGDIKAYLTEFRSLNVYAQCTRESLQEKINRAMPHAIIDMRFAHHMGEFVDYEHILTTTYEAGVHVEQRKPLEEIQGHQKEKEGKECPSQGKALGKDRKGQGKEDPRPPRKAAQGGQATRPGFGQSGQWAIKEEALVRLPAGVRKEYGASEENCWRCGRAGHRTFEYFANSTKKGTTLASAPGKVASSAKSKWTNDDDPETPTAAKPHLSTVKVEDSNMREATAV